MPWGEQWIEEVTDVEVAQTSQAEHLEGEHLKFKAHIRGWKTEIRKERCQQLLGKNDHNLRRALLRPLWKDVLLIPQAWYPEHKPRYETQGWWYAPAGEILGRECKSCKAFHELAEYAGTKRREKSRGHCRNCQSKESQTDTPSTRRKRKTAAHKRATVMNGDSIPRRSERTSGRERVDYRESLMECDTLSDNDEDDESTTLSYRLKLQAADPRYITNSEDGNRGDVICTVEQVRELIARKAAAEDGIAAIWLTTAEMGFSLTEEQDEVVCAKDGKEGKITGRFLAPAISRFATDTRSMNRQPEDVQRELENLHQRWGRTNTITYSENIKEQADKEAKVTEKFIRIIQRKDLPWERDSIARAANDPEHIPDCNVNATVGRHFLFHEPIPRATNGQGYLRVTTKSLWWQHEQFPTVWTAEGLSTCSENGYQWTVNSTTWNHLRVQWQGQQEEAAKQQAAEEAKAKAEAEARRMQKEAAKQQPAAEDKRKKEEKRKREEPLDLLRSIHEEVHLQNTLEASGYRSPTWRILRALQVCSEAKALVGESMITAAPFFEGAGRPSKPYWGPQRGRRVILWESLSPEDQQKCLTELQNDEEWVIWCKANPKDKTTQAFREYGRCIFEGKRAKVTQANDNQEGGSGGKHVTRARGFWKRGDVAACAAQTNMQCWASNKMIFDDEQVATQLSEAWEHDSSKDELSVVLQGLEQHFWRGTEAGWLGCYDFPGETWAGDGSVYKWVMGAGCVCLQQPGYILMVRVGREEEGVSSLRAELAAIARTLQTVPVESDLLYLCDSEAALNKISQWIGSGPRATLAGDANADIMTTIIERLRERVLRGARTFMVKIKAHRGEPLNEKADTQAENARQLSPECQQWTTRTQRMTYEWEDNNGIRHVTAWSKAVRNAMLRGGAEYQVQRVLDRAGTNWNKHFLQSADAGRQDIRQSACAGVQSDLMDAESWGRRCMLQLQVTENWNKAAATTWSADFLLREGESRECLGSWINSSAVHEAKKRRAKQIITCSFPCGKWLHMIGVRKSPGCELCRRERRQNQSSDEALPLETVAHLQSAGCKAQKKSVIGAHNRCWGYLRGAILMHGEAKRDLEFIGGEQDRQLQQLWTETKIGDIFPWEDVEREAEKLLESIRANEQGSENSGASQEQDDDRIVDRDETDPYNEVIFGRRRPDSVAIEWTSKTVYVLEFKRTSDQRQDYRERGERRARLQHDVLVNSLDIVAKEAKGESAGWTVKLIIFVGGTCGSVHVQTFNSNLKELGVVESKRNTIRRGFVHELLNVQDTVLCSYFAQRMGTKNSGGGQKSDGEEIFQGLERFE